MRQKTMKGTAALAFVLLLLLGLVAWSTPAGAIVQAAAPANLSGTAGAGAGSATITWSNAGANRSFTVQSASFVSGVKSYTAAGTATSLNVTGLQPGNVYFFRIRAMSNTGVYSAWSKPISVTP